MSRGRPGTTRIEPTMGASRLVALDVVLLLPRAAAVALGRLNARLRPPPDGFAFDGTHLPHVTLVQQFVREADLRAVLPALRRVASETPPVSLHGVGLRRGRSTTSLGIDGGAALRLLHDRLLEHLEPHAAPPSDGSAFVAEGEPARDADVDWVTHFRTQAAGARFEPHVTLGVGALAEAAPRIAFTATELAACHLGRFCTCRRVLGAWPLGATAEAAAEPES